MRRTLRFTFAACTFLVALLALDSAKSQQEPGTPAGDSYYLYTKALHVGENGVVKIPAGYRWSVETSWSGVDLAGRNLPDSRVMLRLHDPRANFSAVTAQLDLATAARLHHELGEVIIKKLQDPDYQDRSHVGPAQADVPVKRIIGVGPDGVAILEDVTPSEE